MIDLIFTEEYFRNLERQFIVFVSDHCDAVGISPFIQPLLPPTHCFGGRGIVHCSLLLIECYKMIDPIFIEEYFRNLEK